MVETASITTKETDLQRARELAGARRRANRPSSAQEGGFQASHQRSAAPQNLNNGQNGSEVEYKHGLRDARKSAEPEHGDVDRRAVYDNERRRSKNIRSGQGEEAAPSNREILRASDKEIEHKRSLAAVRKALEEVDPEKSKKLKEIEQKYESGIKTAKEAKTIAKSATPWGFWSLMRESSLLVDWMYIAAILAAVFKDAVVDGSQLGTVPVIGAVITALVSIFMFMMYYLSNFIKHDRSVFQKQIISWLVGFLIDAIPIFNELPSLTTSAVIIYMFALASRKNAKNEQKETKKALKE